MPDIKEKLFGNLDFSEIRFNPDFKEDSVREVIILPILKELGYEQKNIIRSKALQHPFLKIGSKKRPITLIPDYILSINQNHAWVLDAKAPDQQIINSDHVEQVFSYAIHHEIRSTFFALCNGLEFVVYKTGSNNIPLLLFNLDEINFHWEKLSNLLSINQFQTGKKFDYINEDNSKTKFDYLQQPLLKEFPVIKRAAKRHFGVHGYFTRQSWNFVAEYIKNFSKTDDVVLDPFGGSGITAIEALMNNRKAINIDINPLAIFMVDSLSAPIDINEFTKSFYILKDKFESNAPKNNYEIRTYLKKYKYPTGIVLPKSSDVVSVEELFSDKQIANLAYLKHLIYQEKDANIRKTFLLMFSGIITKYNLTYHTSTYVEKEGGGNAAPFAYYRYRLAPNPVEIDLMTYFEIRYKKILAAKKEIQYHINDKTIGNLTNVKGTATDLSWIDKESVDYIYTDPPYGKKIPYLDLSIMWNAWLDLVVTEQDYELEAIEGGEHHKTKENYNELIAKSIEEMYRVLKFDRWMSFVFAHKDPEFWHLIIDTAERCGFEYVGAVSQKNGQTSFKKRQNPFTVLSGQLIINFKKVRNPKSLMKANLGMNISEIIIQTIEGIIAKDNGATLEQINDELIIKGLELGFLDLLKKEYADITPFLLNNFDYSEKTQKYTIKQQAKFKTNIDIRLRIKYYLISYLRRKQNEGHFPSFDDIVLDIMPLLKNGITPERQTILSVLEDIAEHIGSNQWKLKEEGQINIFGKNF